MRKLINFISALWVVGLITAITGRSYPVFAQSFQPKTDEAGLNLVLLAGNGTNSVSAADYNNDGHTDLYFVLPQAFNPTNKGTWNLLYRGTSSNTFREVNSNVGTYGKGSNIQASYMGNKLGASWGDYNNDGFADLFLFNAGPDQLLKNNGDGTFTDIWLVFAHVVSGTGARPACRAGSDITATAGVAGGSEQFSSHGLWFDYDSDGDLDLYVSVWENYTDQNRVINNRMYENIGSGLFTDVSEISGLNDPGKTWMSMAFDFNQDGLLDLYLANDFGPNKLYINHPDKTFTEETASYGLEDSFEGMGLSIGDANNDGLFDLYLTNATEQTPGSPQINPLFIQQSDTTFTNKSASAGVDKAGWGWGTEFMDFNNDGRQDLLVVNGYFEAYTQPNYLFKNVSTSDSIYFQNVSSELGVDSQQESRTFLPFDYNNDGYLDLLISNFSDDPILYENTHQEGNWIKVKLEGTETNRNGFGSIIEIESEGKIQRRYYHGAHFYGQSILPVHFGINEAAKINRFTVHWLGGHSDEILNVDINQTIHVKEKEGLVSTHTEPQNQSINPEDFRLIGNYPNPFNGTTHIQFEIKKPGLASLKLYNVLGKHIYAYSHTFNSSGLKTLSIDTSDLNYAGLNSGVYFYQVSINGIAKTGKMNYIK